MPSYRGGSQDSLQWFTRAEFSITNVRLVSRNSIRIIVLSCHNRAINLLRLAFREDDLVHHTAGKKRLHSGTYRPIRKLHAMVMSTNATTYQAI